MVTMDDILNLTGEMEENYKHLHQHPELGFEETETSRYILDKLTEYGLAGRQVARTGILADIVGHKPGKTIGIRADIDALPILEESGVEYSSQTPGVMHACGHDAHASMLLCVAHYLADHRDSFCGTVRLIFQPAEEGAAPETYAAVEAEGGSALGGAASMIAYGALKGVDACIALHVDPLYPVGSLHVPVDRMSASSDVFELTIQGKGGHGSAPEASIESTGALADIINAYNAFPAREISALESVALSIGAIHGGQAWNVIPDSIYMTGGVRCFSNEIRNYVFQRLREIAEGICTAHRCTAKFVRHEGYAPTINNREMSSQMMKVASNFMNAVPWDTPMMGSEDVGYYFQQVPGVMAWLGAMPEDGPVVGHNPHFHLSLEALRYGVLVHLNTALDYLNNEL